MADAWKVYGSYLLVGRLGVYWTLEEWWVMDAKWISSSLSRAEGGWSVELQDVFLALTGLWD